MLGLMLAGAEFALRGVDTPRLLPRSLKPGPDWEPLGMLVAAPS